MKLAYPVVLHPEADGGYVVYVPDFQINTEGNTLPESLFMARDAIGIVGITREDEGRPIPAPSDFSTVKGEDEHDLVSLVDIDFAEYRVANDLRAVKKNCTVPHWLADKAEKAHINFSAVLQNGLKQELRIAQ